MNPVLRNALFTLMMLVLSGVGLSWNAKTIKGDQPIFISQSVLASTATASFPVTITFSQPTVPLGEPQSITIATEPNTQLQIAVQFSNGNIGNGQTATTNNNGYYNFSYNVSDFHNTGSVIIKVVATNPHHQTSTATAEYTVSP